MAGKTRPMSQIKQLIRLHQHGYGIKTIARSLSISKNTVKSYLQKIGEAGLDLKELLSLEDPVLEGLFHSGNPAYRDPRFEDLKERLDYFESELKRVGVNRKLLWEEYIADYPPGYAYSQFCYHLQQQLVARRNGSFVMEHRPGEKLYIDFSGKKLHYIDRVTGNPVVCEVFVACLPYSSYCFAMAVASQRTPDFLYALDCCLRFLGGAPQVLVPDNLKSAVTRSDRYEPEINRCMEDFANHYGTVVVPARARRPKDKGPVESHVNIVYTQVFARLRKRRFFDLGSLNEAIGERVAKLNQTRMQNRSYCRQERFLSSERHTLLSLPEHRFEMKYYAQLKVAANGHIFLRREQHSYSVPYIHIGAKAQVVYTHRMVYIYIQGKQVAVHRRSYSANAYTTVAEHLSSRHRAYSLRSPQYYIQRAQRLSTAFGMLVELIFSQQGRYPEQLYRTCEGLFRLQRNYTADEFEGACSLATEHRVFSYRFVQNVLQSGMAIDRSADAGTGPLPEHGNIRGRDYYNVNSKP